MEDMNGRKQDYVQKDSLAHQKGMARYLVAVVDRGMTSEVLHFISLDEAKNAFGEIANDYGYEPEEINASDYYDVSIWEWTEDRFEKLSGY